MQLRERTRTLTQQAVVDQLVRQYNVAGDRILFLSDRDPNEPWLPYDQLIAIARRSGEFRSISEDYREYIPELQHLIHSATVVDPEGRSYTRSGAAMLGEKLPNEVQPDEHNLAASRALNAALNAAGFHPLKAAPMLDLRLSPDQHQVVDQAESRRNDLKTIHAIAEEKGLIAPLDEDPSQKDFSGYRNFLKEQFGTNTTANMGPAERAVVINALRALPEPEGPRSNIAWPSESR